MHHPPIPAHATACLLMEDGTLFFGTGIGAEQTVFGEICFNTAMTGYQEILTDPSYHGQVITFTFPHIGNTGINPDDYESRAMTASGLVIRNDITTASSWRATDQLESWLAFHDKTGICGIDTRALTRRIRDHGACNVLISYSAAGTFDIPALKKQLSLVPPMHGRDLAGDVSTPKPYEWNTGHKCSRHIVVIDYGVKQNILRLLAGQGARLTIVPAKMPAAQILELNPDGVFLSNGPGDPAATAAYAVPIIQALIAKGLPVFGICLGHQLLARAFGGETEKLAFGHRGANHPVKNLETGLVEITSQNHGFVVKSGTLPDDVIETHVSLFDGSNEGLRHKHLPVFSVQHHPEASPGPQDSYYLFTEFTRLMDERETRKRKKAA